MDLQAVEAATKKHEAIETDIGAYGERVAAVEAVARELEAESYHDVRRVAARRDNVLRLWEYLKELLAARRERLIKQMLRCLGATLGTLLISLALHVTAIAAATGALNHFCDTQ